jgi:hypothetical protein
MAEEDFICSGWREGLSRDYSDLVDALHVNCHPVHQYHKNFRDFLNALENQCYLCTAVWRSLSAESQATYLQENTSTQKTWGEMNLDVSMCDDQPPSLLLRIMIRNRDGAGSNINNFRIIPFTGTLRQQLLPCSAIVWHFSC